VEEKASMFFGDDKKEADVVFDKIHGVWCVCYQHHGGCRELFSGHLCTFFMLGLVEASSTTCTLFR
jgi:hypothetical protein